MIKYAIREKIVNEPEIELPEGSLPVSVKHHDAYEVEGVSWFPECWQVVWLEPVR